MTKLRTLCRRAIDAREEERRRLAKVLHDDVVQALTGLIYHAVELPGLCEEDAESFVEKVVKVGDRCRRVIRQLSPPPLDWPLAEMIHSLPSEDASLSVFSRINPTVDKVLPPEIKLAAYRVIQESVNNAVRNSDADSIVIRLALNDQGLSFEVSDDGSGLDPASGRQEGHSGLTLMREYIDAVGGRLDIRSTPGRGTRVSAAIPVITS